MQRDEGRGMEYVGCHCDMIGTLDLSSYTMHCFFGIFDYFVSVLYVVHLSFKNSVLMGCAAIIAQKGSDAWWYMSVEDLLPAQYSTQANMYKKGTDTMDVWFDSGTYLKLKA